MTSCSESGLHCMSCAICSSRLPWVSEAGTGVALILALPPPPPSPEDASDSRNSELQPFDSHQATSSPFSFPSHKNSNPWHNGDKRGRRIWKPSRWWSLAWPLYFRSAIFRNCPLFAGLDVGPTTGRELILRRGDGRVAIKVIDRQDNVIAVRRIAAD